MNRTYRTTRSLALMLAAVLAATGLSGASSASALPTDVCPTVVAHRTNPNAAPENTLPGIASVPATGAGWVEMDVEWSNSHFPILMHDVTVDRTTNGTGKPHDMSLSSLTALLAQDYAPWKTDPRFATTKVPYAWEFLDQAQRSNLNVLLHIVGESPPDASDIDKLAEYINRFSYAPRSVFLGGEAVVRAMRNRQPTWRYVMMEYPANGNMRTNEWLSQLGVIGYGLPAGLITPAKVDYYHAGGMEMWTWTSDNGFDTPEVRAQVRAAGVNVLVSNQPTAAILECPPSPLSSQIAR